MNNPDISCLSSSAPAVSSMLDNLHTNRHGSNNTDRCNSLDNKLNLSDESLFRDKDKESLKSNSAVNLNTDDNLSDSTSGLAVKPLNNDTIDGKTKIINKDNRASSISSGNKPKDSMLNKRILSATPPNNMSSRQVSTS